GAAEAPPPQRTERGTLSGWGKARARRYRGERRRLQSARGGGAFSPVCTIAARQLSDRDQSDRPRHGEGGRAGHVRPAFARDSGRVTVKRPGFEPGLSVVGRGSFRRGTWKTVQAAAAHRNEA